MTTPRKPLERLAGTFLLAGLLASLLATAACEGGAGPDPEAPPIGSQAELQVGPSAADAANATYAGIYEQPVTLTEGTYEGEPFVPDGASRPRVGLVEELQLTADLDRAGVVDRFVLLWESTGGSGVNLYLARVASDRSATATLVGNRVQVRALSMDDDALRLDVLRPGPDDAMCCAGELATLRWRSLNRGLELATDETTGRFGLATIAGEWRLASTPEELAGWILGDAAREELEEARDRGAPVAVAPGAEIPEAEITLMFTAEGQTAGRSACNRYSGSARFTEPNELSFGPLALTMMACPDPVLRLERAYMTRLQGVVSAGFRNGRLALTWRVGDEYDVLLFDRVE